MRIALDAKRAFFNHTGLGNYSRYAVGALAEAYPDNDYLLYARKLPATLPDVCRLPDVRPVTPDTAGARMLGPVWRHFGGLAPQLRRDGAEIYHGLSNELPFDISRAGIPSVVTIHDLIFRRIPDNYKPIDRLLYDLKFRHAACAATRVIAISERTKADIIELYGIPDDRIDVIYQGCDPLFSRPVTRETLDEVKALYHLPERYIVSVGTLEQRKNQLLAVEALPMLPPDVRLVTVGRERNSYGRLLDSRIDALGLGDRVMRLHGVPTSHLPALYALATAASYTSRYEGFGLPLLEAIGSGTPVIAATGSCLEEAGGPGAIYVDPDSPRRFADAATALLGDPALRSRMVAEGRRWVARFDRRTFAARVMDTYDRAISQYHRKN